MKMFKECGSSLVDLKASEEARIVKINTDDILKLRKLTAFGIMPGVEVTMVQKYPAFVIQVGFTQIALDEGIASEVMIQRK